MQSQPLLLLVDDDVDILQSLSINLQADGYRTYCAASGAAALTAVRSELPALAIVDLMMPGTDGFETSRRIKSWADVPIIILTAIDNDQTKVRAIELYADDYLTKPFGYAELAARVRRILSRAWPYGPPESAVTVDECLRIDFGARAIRVNGDERRLSPTECRLLHLLHANAGHTLPSGLILDRVWPEGEGEIGYLWEYVRRLREKLGDDPVNPRYIVSERAVGYRFQAPVR